MSVGECMQFKYLNIITIAIVAAIGAQTANALPTFARQTGVSCGMCHNGNFAALTSFGRQFKLQGYVMSSEAKVEKTQSSTDSRQLSLPTLPGLSAMMQISMTHTKAGTSGTQNNAVKLPEQLSLFLAGRLTDKLGIFSQFTMTDTDKFGIDNTDIRYADNTQVGGKSLDYGFTLDNNPTVGDLWNSTPAWGFPYSGGTADTAFVGSQGTSVVGVGSYGMLDNQFYGKLALYRSESAASTATTGTPASNVLVNTAPYWRLAWQKNIGKGYLMLGTYGMSARVMPAATTTPTGIGGPESKYLDTALDFQYEHPITDQSSLITHGSYTREKRTDLDGSGNYSSGANTTWKFSKLDAQVNMGKFRPGIVWFNTNTGTDNADNTGYQLEMSYFPWENIQVQALYSGYTKFGGTSTKASGNNLASLQLWVML